MFGHTKVRGHHPLVATVAGTGDVVHSRLRGAHASLRADSGFYSGKVVGACRKADVRFSVTVKLNPALRKAIAAIAADEWVPIPYFLA